MEEHRIQTDLINPKYFLPHGEPILQTRKVGKKTVTIRKDVVVTESPRGGIELRSFAFPLNFYLHRQRINIQQYNAGERLLGLWRIGCPSLYCQSQYSDYNGGGQKLEFMPLGMGAVKYRAAILAISGELERAVAYGVCIEGIPATHAVRFSSRRTAERKGIEHLRNALDDLISHFKSEREAARTPIHTRTSYHADN